MNTDRRYLWWEFNETKRIEYLEKLKLSNPEDASDIDVFLRLIEYRYRPEKRRAADKFMRFWVTLAFHAQRINSNSALLQARREILGYLDNKELRSILEASESGEEILHVELMNSLLLYLQACYSDPNYKSYAFGLMKMDDEALMNKIISQVNDMAVALPERAGLVQELAFVSSVVLEGAEIFKSAALERWR